MEKIIEQLLKSFEHIARDIQIYMLSGCVVLLDLVFLDWKYNRLVVFREIGRGPLMLFALGIVAYLVGNICLAFYYCARNLCNGRRKTETRLIEEERIAMEINVFKSDQTAYTYFVERYSLLHNMRGAMSVAFFIAAVFHVSVWKRTPGNILTLIGVSAVLCLVVSVSLFILARGTEKSMNERVIGLRKSS